MELIKGFIETRRRLRLIKKINRRNWEFEENVTRKRSIDINVRKWCQLVERIAKIEVWIKFIIDEIVNGRSKIIE